MRVLILGNSGSGKSTLARAIAAEHDLVHLDLDTVVWEPHQVAVARPEAAVREALAAFAAGNARWVVEGSYGDWAEFLAPWASELRWLDPTTEWCLRNHEQRPWEPHKYDDPSEQERHRAFLAEWVRSYATRDDRFGRTWHQGVYERFAGPKRVLRDDDLR